MVEEIVQVRTPDGVVEALVTRPDGGERLPAVINLTDGLGFRAAFADQSRKIAEHGFVVLTPNIFYRTSKVPVFTFTPDFGDDKTRERFRELTGPLTPVAMARDGSAYVDYLAAQPFVSEGPMAVIGFCFSGKFALQVAAARPDRIAAAASFHGGGLFTDTADSPHLVLPRVKARLYFGHASNDAGMPAEAIEKFEWALRSWGGDYASETYEARHGWMIPGREVFDPASAEKGFGKLMELLSDTLQQNTISA
ncbi:MAG TPA: dienelactone hydrolase family protein [Gemmatimonadaceae bacterium]|jgi:carboxymethylenebutenolidase